MGGEAVQSVELAVVLATGLAMSAGHCAGMCGPLATLLGGVQRARGRSVAGFLTTYHAGRILSYAIMGAMAGGLGAALPDAVVPRSGLSVIVGALMIIVALGLIGWLPQPILRILEASPLGAIPCQLKKLFEDASPLGRFLLGMGNGWLPCGPVVAMALAAATTASPWKGSLVMAVFGLGTVPALAVLSFGASWLPVVWRQRLYKVGNGLVVLVGLQLALRGAAGLGLVPGLRLGPVVFF